MQWNDVLNFNNDQSPLMWLPLASSLCLGSFIPPAKTDEAIAQGNYG